MAWSYRLSEVARITGACPPEADPAVSGVFTDSRNVQNGAIFFALKGERFDAADFVDDALRNGAAAAVSTRPADAGPCLVVDDPLAALQRFAAWHRERHPVPMLAITGSAGKTSVKDMTAAVLATRYNVVKTQGNLNNDIGCPLSLLGIDTGTEFAVIEMGANHAGEIAALCELARPTESAITLVAPAHLEGFGSVADVARAKSEIVEGLPPDGTFYMNVDNPWCVRAAEKHPGRTVAVGSKGDVALRSCVRREDGLMALEIHPVGTLALPLYARAHAMNVVLAVAVGLEHGITAFEEPLREALAQTTRLRLKQVGRIEVIDDSYNANPVSMAAAFEALAGRPGGMKLAALGDMLEMGPESARYHRELGAVAAEAGVQALFARGSYAEDVVAGAREGGVPVAEAVQDHEAIGERIRALAHSGDVLLVKGSRGMRMERVIEALEKD
jgi:UDP-N-acetylmuramoyl-tripeptide--D-alanyl-D-alanine ligase